jgi:hypothetical protein
MMEWLKVVDPKFKPQYCKKKKKKKAKTKKPAILNQK